RLRIIPGSMGPLQGIRQADPDEQGNRSCSNRRRRCLSPAAARRVHPESDLAKSTPCRRPGGVLLVPFATPECVTLTFPSDGKALLQKDGQPTRGGVVKDDGGSPGPIAGPHLVRAAGAGHHEDLEARSDLRRLANQDRRPPP